MAALLTITAILANFTQNFFKKQYSRKTDNGTFTFSAMVALSATILFIVTATDFTFDARVVPYSLFFAFFYGLAIAGSYLAFASGSFTLTTLINSYSLTIPTLYGLVWLDEPFGFTTCVGLLVLIASLYLMRASDKSSINLSLKWIVFAFLSYLGNGMCSVVQIMQQNAFFGYYKNEFIIMALIPVISAFLIIALTYERKHIKAAIKHGAIPGGLCGIANGTLNYLVMLVTATVPASVFFPVLSGSGLILSFAFSVFAYKEKFVTRQIVGVALGIIALIFLNT